METTVKPKRGQRFRHARYLALGDDDIRRPAECVVTAVRQIGVDTIIFWTYADCWDKGDHKARWKFKLSSAASSVQEWLTSNADKEIQT